MAIVAIATGYCDNLLFNVVIQTVVAIVVESANERAAQQLNDKLARLERSEKDEERG